MFKQKEEKMKRMTYSIKLLMICIALGFTMPALAQNDRDREDTRNERLNDRDEADRNKDDLRDEDENEARNEDDDDSDYGWIGLIGLAGLAGLLRRDNNKRTVHTDTGYRSTNTGTGRTDLGSGTTNRSV
jgi:MYXO-CTERM domain-containing protein